jgi:hypothetical protein
MRKVKLTPLQREILWTADENELGVCSLLQILDRLQQIFPEQPPELFLKEVQRALQVLWRMGCFYLSSQHGESLKTIKVHEMDEFDLRHIVQRNPLNMHWELILQEPPLDNIILELTNGGAEVLSLIGPRPAPSLDATPDEV